MAFLDVGLEAYILIGVDMYRKQESKTCCCLGSKNQKCVILASQIKSAND